jgi:hypothetical protein
VQTSTAKWSALLLYIQEVLHSNLGPETGYPEVLRGFLWSLQANSILN